MKDEHLIKEIREIVRRQHAHSLLSALQVQLGKNITNPQEQVYKDTEPFVDQIYTLILSEKNMIKSKSIQDKLNEELGQDPSICSKCGCYFSSGFHSEQCVEQSNPNSPEEQKSKCSEEYPCGCHFGEVFHANGKCSCHPKTEDFYEDAFTEEDLKTERIRNAKMNDHLDSIRKTEDTGECNCTPDCNSHNCGCPIHSNKENPSAPLNKDWEDDFDSMFRSLHPKHKKYIKSFISQEIESARASERKATIREILLLIDFNYGKDTISRFNLEKKLDELLSKIENE